MKFLYVIFLAFAAVSAANAKLLEVKDPKGRAIEIVLIQVVDDQVTFKRKGKVHTLTMDKFHADSQAEIRAAAKVLPPPLPNLAFGKVAVTKRGKDHGRSRWEEQQAIKGWIEVKNNDKDIASSPCKTTVLVLGQDQQKTELYSVITRQSWDTQPGAGATVRHEIKEVITVYDSDNKGRGNFGGFKFCGYIIVVTTADGQLVLEKVIGGMPRNAVTKDRSILLRTDEFPTGQELNAEFNTDPEVLSKIQVTRR